MPLALPRFTIADIDAIPDDGNRYEVLDGVLLVTPGPGSVHQIVLARLTGRLAGYLGEDGPAVVVSPGVVQVGPDTQLEPDGLVLAARWTSGMHWRDMTDQWLAIEVSGRDSRLYDRDYKREAYHRLGVREVWRVDLRDQAVYVSTIAQRTEVRHSTSLPWHPPEMAAPLSIEVRKLFAGTTGSAWS